MVKAGQAGAHAEHGVEVAVLGSGPAGLSLAAELARRGLRVRCIDAALGAPWPANYGVWAPDADAAGVEDLVRLRMPTPRIVDADGRAAAVPADYLVLDNAGLQARWQGGITGQGGGLVRADATALHPVEGGLQVETEAGALVARLVIDACGARRRWMGWPAPVPDGWQIAWGEEVAPGGLDGDGVLMDFRAPDPSTATPWPTFLYALPLVDGGHFWEETILTTADPPDPEALQDWLAARAQGWGGALRGRGIERCRIPMGGDLPRPHPRGWPVVPWGAAAGFVLPASGYSLGHTLRWAPAMADAVAAAMATDGPVPTAGIWEALWPPARRALWRLYRYGGLALASMDRRDAGRFFVSFVEADPEGALAYLRADLPVAGVRRMMWRVFREVDGGLRWRLMGPALGGHGLLLRP